MSKKAKFSDEDLEEMEGGVNNDTLRSDSYCSS